MNCIKLGLLAGTVALVAGACTTPPAGQTDEDSVEEPVLVQPQDCLRPNKGNKGLNRDQKLTPSSRCKSDNTTTTAPTSSSTTTTTSTSTTIPAPAPVRSAPQPLPAGATLREIDGGLDYFGQWSNSFPTDPNFFPIGVWAETFGYDDAPTRAMVDDYKSLGINTFVGSYGNPSALDYYVGANGMYFVGPGGPTATASNDTTDEPDLFPCEHYQDNWYWPSEVPCENTWANAVSPKSLQAWADLERAKDPSRPVYGQFTRTQTVDLDALGCVAWGIDDTTARAYAATSDILSFDYYVLVNTWIPDACRHHYIQGDAVNGMRRVSDYQKPVWFFVETSQTESGWDPLPDVEALEADVWSGLVAGARGLQWFNHCFCGDRSTSRVLRDSRYAPVRSKVNAINQQVQSLAPVLNADFIDNYVSAAGAVDTMAKYHNGDVYLFAVPNRDDGSQSATFTVPGLNGGTVEVVGEGRSIKANGDSFTDNFGVYEHHIYRWTP